MLTEFRQRYAGRHFKGVDQPGLHLNPARPPGAAARKTPWSAARAPADRSGGRDAVQSGRSTTALARIKRRDHSFPQVHGKWLGNRWSHYLALRK